MSEEELVSVYGILRHPVRMRILDLLATYGPLGFSQLHSKLKIGVGKLYYHLDKLGPLISQDEERRYFLTQDGLRVQRFLTSSRGRLLVAKHPEAIRMPGKLVAPFFPGALFVRLARKPLSYLPIAFALALVGGFVAAWTGLRPVLLFCYPATPSLELAAMFLGGWVALTLLSEAIARTIFRQPGGFTCLAVGSSIALTPLTIYFLVRSAIKAAPALAGLGDGLLIYLLLIVAQIWSLCLLATAISYAKGLGIERSLLIGLLIFYLNFVLIGFIR